MNACNAGGDLAGDEGAATARTLMVEKDSVGQVHTIGLTVVYENPEGVLLGNGVRGAGVEGGSLRLGDLAYLAVEL